jgi:hypothetical protein
LGNVRASQDLQALPRGSRKITALHESAFGRYCCKSRKSNDNKNLAKADF